MREGWHDIIESGYIINVILIVSDTLRRDHLPCYGNEDVLAPRLSAFAEQALVFERCYGASFPTVPARADLMTGRYTFTYLDWGPLPQSEHTLAEYLSDAGYPTFGVTDTPFLLRNGYGYDRGFRDFQWFRGQRSGPEHDDVVSQRRSEEDYFAPRTFRAAVQWLERNHKEKFFLYVDTWDPHEPWDPPDYYVRPYYSDYAGELVNPCYWYWKEDGFTQKDLDIAHACYRGEISMVDRWFGILIDRLKSLDLLETTAVLFLSDHGFYFGEHGLFGKRLFRWPEDLSFTEGLERGLATDAGFTYRSPLHTELTQVPLLMHIPGFDAGRIGGLVSIPDIMPTILELVGLSLPGGVQAKSLVPLMRADAGDVHDLIVTSAPLETAGETTKTVDDLARKAVEVSPSTITDGTWDFLYSVEGETNELYRSEEDPGHKNNLSEERPDVVEKLHAKFSKWLAAVGTPEHLLTPRKKI